LLAIVVLGLASVAILLAFATTISGSAEHRNLTTMDTVLRTAAEEAITQIQQAPSAQWGSCSPNPTDTSNVSFTFPTGSGYTASITSVLYWNSATSSFTGTCVPSTSLSPQVNSPQLVQVTVTSSTGAQASISFVVSDPQARAVPSPGTETHLAFISPVTGTSFQAGSNFPIDSQPVVAVEDANNEIVTSDGLPPVTLTLNPPAGSTGASLSNCSASVYTGVVTFSNCSIDVAGTGYTMTATDSLLTQTGDTPSTTSVTFNVTAAPSAQFAFTSNAVSGPASSGANLGPITVQEQDAFGNPTTAAEAVSLSSNTTGTAVFSATPGGAPITSISIPAGSSSASFYYGDTAAGTPTITASGALTSDTQVESITGGAATQLSFTTSPSSTTVAGVSFSSQPVVTLLDAFGNVATADSSTVTLTTTVGTGSSGATVSGCLQTETLGVVSFSGCSVNKVGTGYTLTATDGTLVPDTSNAFNITVGSPSQFAIISNPVTGAAASSAAIGPITVQEQDAFGNPTTSAETVFLSSNSSGTAVFSATSGGATVTHVSIPFGSSTATFYYGDTKSGVPTITASGSLVSATQFETINPATANKLAFNPATPGPGVAGTAIPNVTVQVLDSFGNVATSANGSVGVSINSGAGTFTSGSTISVPVSSGAATFSNLQINTAGSYTFTATPSGITGILNTATVNSSSFTVSPASVASFTVATPATQTAGTAFNDTITAIDTYGNTVTAYTGSKPITFSGPSNSPNATAPTYPSSPVTFTAGVYTASIKLVDAQSTTLTATQTGSSPSITGTSGSFTVNPLATASGFTVATPATQTAGTAFNDTITAIDTYGNTVTAYTGSKTITFSGPSNSPNGTAPTYPTSPVTFTAGVYTASIKLVDAQSTTLTATQSGPTITGTSGSFTVSALTTTTAFAVANPGTQTAGTAFNVTITATDTYGNTTVGYTGAKTITFSGPSNSPNATAPTYPSSPVTFTAGVYTASIKLVDAQTTTLTAAQSGPTITGTSGSFTVAPVTPLSVALANNNGTAGTGDSATIVMSQQINASTLCSVWTNSGTQSISNATIALSNSGSNDVLSVTSASTCSGGGNFGTVPNGGNYVSSTVTFTNSTVQWSPTTDTLTFTLGTKNSGSVRNGVGAGDPGYTASANVKDMFNNVVSTTLFTSGTASGF
jgi:hypothetical protein